MLTPAQVSDLYAPKTRKGKSLGKAFTRDGWESITKVGDYNLGSFQGKVGSIRRSAKGRTRRMPDGSRRYFEPYMEGKEVIAYKLKSK
jgi:hypothetical protein